MVTTMNRIKEARKASGMKQQQVATALNVKQNTISCWENNQAEPGITSLCKLAQLFNTTVDFLVGNDAKKDAADEPTKDETPKDVLAECLTELQNREEMKLLFQTVKGATKDQILAIVLMLEQFNK